MNTPSISASMNRKAAMYSPTRLSMVLLARMQIGIRNTLSMISISAMPSMPSDQRAPLDHPRRAVGPEPVDDALVAALPEQPAEPERRPHEQEVVELVEVPLVEHEPVHRPDLLDGLRGDRRVADVGHPGHEQ